LSGGRRCLHESVRRVPWCMEGHSYRSHRITIIVAGGGGGGSVGLQEEWEEQGGSSSGRPELSARVVRALQRCVCVGGWRGSVGGLLVGQLGCAPGMCLCCILTRTPATSGMLMDWFTSVLPACRELIPHVLKSAHSTVMQPFSTKSATPMHAAYHCQMHASVILAMCCSSRHCNPLTVAELPPPPPGNWTDVLHRYCW
jgi:hypothetical protein